MYRIVDNTLQQGDTAACEHFCGNIDIFTVNNRDEINSNVGVFQCTLPLTGDSCVVEYYFAFGTGSETRSTLYVVNAASGM